MTLKEKIEDYEHFLEDQVEFKHLDNLYDTLIQEYNEDLDNYLKEKRQYPNSVSFSEKSTSCTNQLELLSELRIIHCYRVFEKNRLLLMKLISTDTTYKIEEKSLKSIYTWNGFTDVLKLILGKEYSEINGFNELNELNDCSNYLKHSGINSNEKDVNFYKIPEFEKYENYEAKPYINIEIEDFEEFYNRVKQAGYKVLFDICSRIIYKIECT